MRDQAGDEVFDLVEAVRRRAVDARRGGRSPLDSLADALPHRPIDDQLHLIRAFGWLSLLANTAEDVHHERRRRFHRQHGSHAPARQPRRRRSTTSTGAGLDGADVERLIDDLVVTPVITAHPTEVRRQTVLDVLADVARLLSRPHRLGDDDPDRTDTDEQLELAVLTLWETAEVRLSRLRVVDEINEALRYYPASLFDVVAQIERTVERFADERWGVAVDASRVIRMGSWIGGDRDGNPFVTADVLRTAVARQAVTAYDFHLSCVERAGPGAVDVGPRRHDRRRHSRSWPRSPATRRRSASTSRTAGRCAACTAASSPAPSKRWPVRPRPYGSPPPAVAGAGLRVDGRAARRPRRRGRSRCDRTAPGRSPTTSSHRCAARS